MSPRVRAVVLVCLALVVMLPGRGVSDGTQSVYVTGSGAPTGGCASAGAMYLDYDTGTQHYCNGSTWEAAPTGGTPAWDDVTDKPATFPPEAHQHVAADITDLPEGGGSPCDAYPVGSIFISTASTNPGTSLGCGTWAAFGAGRVLVGLDSGDAAFDTSEETGGSKTVAAEGVNTGAAVTAHSGSAVADHASHTHTYTQVPNHVHPYCSQTATTGSVASYEHGAIDTSSAATECSQTTNNPTGGVATGTTAGPSATLTHNVTQPADHGVTQPTFTGTATSVVQPYVVVHFFRRSS